MNNVLQILVGKAVVKRPFKNMGWANREIDLKEIGNDGMKGIRPSQRRVRHGSEISGFIQGCEFLDQLSDFELLRDAVPHSSS